MVLTLLPTVQTPLGSPRVSQLRTLLAADKDGLRSGSKVGHAHPPS